APHRRDDSDRACVRAFAQHEARYTSAISHPVEPGRPFLRGGCSAGDECRRFGRQRSLCTEVGTSARAARASDVFRDSQVPTGKECGEPEHYVKKSRIRYHSPASGSAQVRPLRSPIGAAGNGSSANGDRLIIREVVSLCSVLNLVAVAPTWRADANAE